MDALMNQCDAKDGVTDGMISDPLGCNFDPAVLACKNGRSDGCIPPAKLSAIKKAFAGPKNSYGTQVYPGFLYDVGIAETGPVPGLLALGPKGLFGPYPIATELDFDKEARHASDPLVEPASTNLSTFSGNGGKLLFFHGAIPGSRRWIRSSTTDRSPRATAVPTRLPDGAGCFWFPEWATVAAGRRSISSTC
jgi:hypothetical protein